jgi:hypothetical protein
MLATCVVRDLRSFAHYAHQLEQLECQIRRPADQTIR